MRQLQKSLQGGRYSHAYLLVGPKQVGKGTLALNIAQAVNCLSPEDPPCGECTQCQRIAEGRHADVRVIGLQRVGEAGPPRTEIGIGEVREVQSQASLKPYEGSHRVLIIDGAEYMSEEASNALLKTLEEPPPQVLFMLLTSAEEDLLPTIRSRCQRLELKPLPIEEVRTELVSAHSVEHQEAELLAHLSRGRLGWAISAAGDPSIMEARRTTLDPIAQLSEASLEERFEYASELSSLFYRNREGARQTLCMWLRWWRDLLLIVEGAEAFVDNVDWMDTLRLTASQFTTAQIAGFLSAILTTQEALDHNANARLALEVLMLRLPEGRAGVPQR